MKNRLLISAFTALFTLCGAVSCEKIDLMVHTGESGSDAPVAPVSLQDVALLLSSAGLEPGQIAEVHDAVSESVDNGYDEEYTMKDMFKSPGAGVGSEKLKSSVGVAYVLKSASEGKTYSKPLREVFESYYSSGGAVKSTAASGNSAGAAGMPSFTDGAACLDYIKNSDMQIYWPYSGRWDGKTAPVITFNPSDEAKSNIGWYMDTDGKVKEMLVDEEMARERPVWVINTNDDASYTSLEMLRRLNPEWFQGGSLVIKTKAPSTGTKASPSGTKALIMNSFTMLRNYDNWFAGASEFWIKIASVNNFNASTEAELYLYDPDVTDFMIVVKRDQLEITREINTVLVSQWTQQLQSCALMILEDDGGTWTSWDCSAVVKYNSKSFGFDIKIPFRSRDDIVWRGSLGRKYIEETSGLEGQFGDVRIVFSIRDL